MSDETELDIDAEHESLRQKLDDLRPDEYKSGNLDWAQEVVDDLAQLYDENPTAQRRANLDHAEATVKSWDERATRRSNGLLREIKRTGQLPLDWMDYGSLPLSIDKVKHRLGSITANHLESWELAERRRASDDFAARNDACDGARILAEWLTVSGGTFSDLDGDVCITNGSDS